MYSKADQDPDLNEKRAKSLNGNKNKNTFEIDLLLNFGQIVSDES